MTQNLIGRLEPPNIAKNMPKAEAYYDICVWCGLHKVDATYRQKQRTVLCDRCVIKVPKNWKV
jgi:hypothetical protein